MSAIRKTKLKIEKARAEAVSPDVAKHSTYRRRMVYIPPTESNDNAGYFHVSENVDINLMDAWLLHDGGFDGRHVRTAHRCRDLWNNLCPPTHRIVEREGHGHARAAATLIKMKRVAGRDWSVFENAMRWNEPEGWLGSRFSKPKERNVAAVKVIVRRVLEAISR